MSVTSGFFNSLNHDRRYNAQQMSAIFDGIINDGVFANIGVAFAINADTGVSITVGKGKCWFNSAWVYNDTILPLTLEASEMVLDRIDAVVVEVDHNESVRMGDIKIVKGTPSSSPKRPTMVATDKKSQHPLAYIYRKASSTAITQADITNMVGTSECPYITGILQVQNIDNIVAQWEGQWNQWYAEKIAETDSDASELLAEMKSEFDIWFADVQALLDDDVATALAAQVAALQGKFDDLARDSCVYDTIEDSDLDVILGSDGTPIQGKTVFGAGGSDIDLSGYAKKEDLEKVEENLETLATTKLDRTEKFARNRLDNSDFTNPVNQRGQTSYTVVHEYFIDRWLSSEGVTLSVTSNGLSIVNPNKQFAYIYQRLSKLKAGTYTQALKFKNNTGTIELSNSYTEKGIAVGASATVEEGVIYATFTITKDDTNTPWIRYSSTGDAVFEWAALYEGEYTAETLPEYQPKGYAVELAECQRYFYKLNTAWNYLASGVGLGDNRADIPIQLPTRMRLAPTVEIENFDIVKINSIKGLIHPTSYNPVVFNGDRVVLEFSVECTHAYIATLYFDGIGAIIFNADL